MSLEINVKNVSAYDRELQIIDTYTYVVIPSKKHKTFKNVDERAIEYYRNCGFEVEVVKRGMENLNEVPEGLNEKKLDNLNEVGIKKEEKKEVVLNEVGIKVKNKELRTRLQVYDTEMLRALLLDVGINPRNLQNKDKLLELILEQDEGKITNILNSE